MDIEIIRLLGQTKMKLLELSSMDRVAIASALFAEICMESSVQGQEVQEDQKKSTTISLARHLVKSVSDFWGGVAQKR